MRQHQHLLLGRYTDAGIVTAPATDCSDMNRGSATDWLMAVKPVTAVCWQGWQLQTLGGNSRFGNGGATENADFLSLSFSKSVVLGSRDFFPMRESTLKGDEFCMVGSERARSIFVPLSEEVFAQIKNTRFI